MERFRYLDEHERNVAKFRAKKMPFEITPMVPYLTRYVETSEDQTNTILPMAENP